MGIISFCIILILTYLVLGWVSPKIAIPKSWLITGWTVKIGFSFAFLFIFIVYYGHGNLYGDAFNFINDSRLLYEFGLENPIEYFKLLFGLADETHLFETTHLHETNIWSYGDNGDLINDNRLLIRINSLIHFVSFGNVYVHALVLSFISFWGLLLLYCSFKRFFANQRLVYFILILFPSIGFWCSGITKESLMLFGIGSFLFGFTKLIKNVKAQHSILLLVGTGILLYNKPHVGIILLSLSPLLLIGVLIEWNIKWLKAVPLLFVLGLISLTYSPPSVNLLHKVSYKQKDLINIGKGGIFFVNDSSFCAVDFHYLSHFDKQLSDTLIVSQTTPAEYKLFGDYIFHPFTIAPSAEKYPIYLIQPPSASYIDVTPITYSRKQLALNTPAALTNVLLRPYPWDPGSPLKYFSFIENILLLLILIFAVIYRKKTSPEENYFITYFVISALAIVLLIGWTTPILGAIVRYKVAVNLLLLITAGILLRPVNKATHET